MSIRLGAEEIGQKLATNLEGLVKMLLPNGSERGGCWEVGSVNGEEGKTLKVHMTGKFRGHWIDWNGQEDKGDALDLWAAVRQVPLPEAMRQAKEWLGIRAPELERRKYTKPEDDKKPLDANGQAMHWLVNERRLEPAIVNRYRVQGDGEKRCIVFPSYNPAGELQNRSYRTLGGNKRVWQDEDAAPCLFGWHAISDDAYRKREILICEGQIDAMTWAQWGVDALSIPNGSGQTWLDFEWENLEPFATIYLSFDNDGKTAKALQAAIIRLGKHRVRVVKFKHKDANDALKAGAGAAEARQWLDSAEYVTMPHLVSADHYADAVADEFFPEGDATGHALAITRAGLKEFRFRPAELTLWTGVSSHGKSTALNLSLMHLTLATCRPSLICSFEMAPPKIIRRALIGMGQGPKINNRGTAKDAARLLKPYLLFCDKIGSIERKELFELMHYAYARYGVAHIAIDSMMRVRGLQEDYPAQTQFIIDLVTFARETGVHIHLVAHPRKQGGHDAPQAHDIAGSSHIRDNADNVIVIWRNREKEKKREANAKDGWQQMPDAKLIIEKDREEGEYLEFPLEYEPANYRHIRWEPAK